MAQVASAAKPGENPSHFQRQHQHQDGERHNPQKSDAFHGRQVTVPMFAAWCRKNKKR